jgi:hypothetical protein
MRSRLIILAAVLGGTLTVPAASSAGHTSALALDVTFDYAGNITVTLPNGTPVGNAGGQPSVIPAGYYVVTLTQPGCVDVPTFILQGPGVNIQDDLQSGEIVTDGDAADFQPNSTYTWRDGSINPPVLYTFQTSGQVVGTDPGPAAAVQMQTGSNKAESNTDPVGALGSQSSAGPIRGRLVGTLATTGRAALVYKGKPVTSVVAGRYTISATATSTNKGLVIGSGRREMTVVRAGITGAHSLTVTLSTGRWYVGSPAGPKTYFTVVA